MNLKLLFERLVFLRSSMVTECRIDVTALRVLPILPARVQHALADCLGRKSAAEATKHGRIDVLQNSALYATPL
jgi:hypothetical protein